MDHFELKYQNVHLPATSLGLLPRAGQSAENAVLKHLLGITGSVEPSTMARVLLGPEQASTDCSYITDVSHPALAI